MDLAVDRISEDSFSAMEIDWLTVHSLIQNIAKSLFDILGNWDDRSLRTLILLRLSLLHLLNHAFFWLLLFSSSSSGSHQAIDTQSECVCKRQVKVVMHGVFCDLFVCKDVKSFLLHGVSHGSLIGWEAENAVKSSTGHLPQHNVIDVISETYISHEVFGELVDSLILDKPLAEIERGADHSWFIYQHIFCQLKAGI